MTTEADICICHSWPLDPPRESFMKPSGPTVAGGSCQSLPLPSAPTQYSFPTSSGPLRVKAEFQDFPPGPNHLKHPIGLVGIIPLLLILQARTLSAHGNYD